MIPKCTRQHTLQCTVSRYCNNEIISIINYRYTSQCVCFFNIIKSVKSVIMWIKLFWIQTYLVDCFGYCLLHSIIILGSVHLHLLWVCLPSTSRQDVPDDEAQSQQGAVLAFKGLRWGQVWWEQWHSHHSYVWHSCQLVIFGKIPKPYRKYWTFTTVYLKIEHLIYNLTEMQQSNWALVTLWEVAPPGPYSL